MSNNTDKIETNPETFDTTPSQVESLSGRKRIPIHAINVMANQDQLEAFGETMVANTCKEILTAINHGISKEDLISSLESAIECNLESSEGKGHESK